MSRKLKPSQLAPSPLSRRIVRRLRLAGIILKYGDDNYALRGLSPGHWQKSSGAWAWQLFVNRLDGQGWVPLAIGSSDPASSLRTSSEVTWHRAFGSDIEVTIDNSKQRKRH